MTTDVQWAQSLYNQLKPEAIRAARNHVMTRTPATIQDEMATIVDTDIAPNDPPSAIAMPVITVLVPGVGGIYSCTDGPWHGKPTSKAYQWKRGTTNVGTSTSTYTLVAPDIGQPMTCGVTATNAAGSSGPFVSNIIIAA